MSVARSCDWCGVVMVGKRPQAITCSRRCRQARHRFRVRAAHYTTAERAGAKPSRLQEAMSR